jgi:mannose-6-phosphate isomerase-like protein (cupin superfamily)
VKSPVNIPASISEETSLIRPIEFLAPEIHPKAWGEEIWWINHGKYCAKSLKFLAGKEFSDHYHWIKEETWICVSGELVLEYYDLANADKRTKTIKPGDVIHVPPGNPHKLRAITDALIWEVSSRHFDSDSYRIGKGSSQNQSALGAFDIVETKI